mmetsp:Transcript_36179/g.43205  ORF Transcript_36179/g.43205 Transcript_36179/m.43205 type:complete len:400 (+) Transcript_36179:146-1345(+)
MSVRSGEQNRSNALDTLQAQSTMTMSANQADVAASEPMHQLANAVEQYGNNNVYAEARAEADASFASSTPPHAFMTAPNHAIEMGQPSPHSAFVNSIPNVESSSSVSPQEKKRKKSAAAPKQHQLPMFLTKTYHMIDRCDGDIATWSNTGDNFVVKNVEKFACTILPMYFKHSNFSSFARQLNFYGFRKLKAEPILTADYDARTASYVRFFHEKFQKDKPELLYFIKRATKSDIQSKDDVESLRNEVQQLHETVMLIQAESERKMAEMQYEFSTRITMLQKQQQNHGTIVQQNAPRQIFQGQIMLQPQSSLVPPINAPPLKIEPSNNSQNRIPILHQACLSLTSPAGPQPQIQGPLNMGGEKRVVTDDFTLPPAQRPPGSEKRCVTEDFTVTPKTEYHS